MVALRLGRHEQASQLLEAGMRAARREDASLVVIVVVSSQTSPDESRALQHLTELATRRGVRLETLSCESAVAPALLRWARDHGVTAVFMPAPRARRRLPWEKPLAFEVIWQAEELDVHLLGGQLSPQGLGGVASPPPA